MSRSDLTSAVIIPLLISGCGIAITAIVIIIYHFLMVRYCLGRQNRLSAEAVVGLTNGGEAQAGLFNNNKLGLDKSALALIPTVNRSSSAFEDLLRAGQCECAICLGDGSHDVRVLPNCRHAFHAACVDQWLSSHVSCPVCRSRVFPFVLPDCVLDLGKHAATEPGSGLGLGFSNKSHVDVVIGETSHDREIMVAAENVDTHDNGNETRVSHRSSSSSSYFSSCSSSAETTMSERFIRSLSQLRLAAAGWTSSSGSTSSAAADGDHSSNPC